MTRRRALVAFFALLAIAPIAWPTATTPAERALCEGTHEGADYLIGMPPKWNGGLVMFAHGYRGEGPGRGAVSASPLSAHLLERGYAWCCIRTIRPRADDARGVICAAADARDLRRRP